MPREVTDPKELAAIKGRVFGTTANDAQRAVTDPQEYARAMAHLNQGTARAFNPTVSEAAMQIQAQEAPGDKPSVMERTWRQFAHGFSSAAVGGAVALGTMTGWEGLAHKGVDAQDWLDENLAVKDPNFYDHVMSGFGSMFEFLIPSFGVSKAMKLVKAGKFVQRFLGLSAMSATEAAVEMAEIQKDVISGGGTLAEARKESETVFWQNLPVLMATNAPYWSPAGRVAKALIEAPAEALQERWQAAVQESARRNSSGIVEDIDTSMREFMAKDKYWTETGVGAIVGGVTALALPTEGKEGEKGEAEPTKFKKPTPTDFDVEAPPGAPESPVSDVGPPAPIDGGEPPIGPEPQDQPQEIGPKMVASSVNEETGVEAQVYDLGDGRYSLRVLDQDSGEYLPSSMLFNNQEDAVVEARMIASAKGPAEAAPVALPAPVEKPKTVRDILPEKEATAPAEPQPPARESRETPEAEPAPPTKKVATSSLSVDTERFQNRTEAYSEDTVKRIVETYDEREMQPADVWTDPGDGKTYVLEGHSRMEALDRMGITDIETKEFEGTEAEAIRFARRQNESKTAYTSLEQAQNLNAEVKEQGFNKKQRNEYAQAQYGKDWRTVTALSHLNPKGKAADVLKSTAKAGGVGATEQLQMAKWVGATRAAIPELTDAHEREMFDDLVEHYKKRKTHQSELAFRKYVQDVMARTMVAGQFDISMPLNFKKATRKTPAEVKYDERLAEARTNMNEAIKDRAEKEQELLAEDITESQRKKILEKYNDAVTIAQREYFEIDEDRVTLYGHRHDEQALFRATNLRSIRIEGRKSTDAQLREVEVHARSEFGGQPKIKQTTKKPAEHRLIQRMTQLFGAEYTYVEATGLPEGAQIGGFYYDGQVFLNVNAETPLFFIAAHEISHHIQINHTDIYKDVMKVIQQHMDADARIDPEGIIINIDELFAETFATALTKDTFWAKLRELNPASFTQLVDLVLSVLRHIRNLALTRTAKVESYYKNFAPVEKAMQKAGIDIAAQVAARPQPTRQDIPTLFRGNRVGTPHERIMQRRVAGQDAAEAQIEADNKMTASDRWHRLYTWLVDADHPLYVAIARTMKSMNVDLATIDDHVNPYKLLSWLRGWSGRAELFIKHGVYGFTDQDKELAKSIEWTIKEYNLEPVWDEFGQFFVAARVVELHRLRGDEFFGTDPESDEYQKAEAEFREWQTLYEGYRSKTGWLAAVGKFTEYSNALITYLHQAGAISADQVESLMEAEVYAPLEVLTLLTEDGEIETPAGVETPGGKQSWAGRPIYKQGRLIPGAVRINPVEGLVKKTYRLVHLAEQNHIKIQLAAMIKDLAKKAGDWTALGQMVSPKMRPVVKSTMDLLRAMGVNPRDSEVYQEVLRETKDPKAALAAWEEQMESDLSDMGIEDGLDAMKAIWTVSAFQEKGVIAYLDNGEVKYMQVDEDVWKIFAGGPRQMNNVFMKFFSTQTALLRAGAVLTPEFMARNPFRDMISVGVIATHMVKNPVDAVMLPVRVLRGLSHAIRKDEMWRKWVMSGGAHATLVSLDRQFLRMSTEDLRTHGLKGKLDIARKHPTRYLRVTHPLQVLSMFSEEATRLAVYEKHLSEFLNAGMLKKEAELKAAIQSREASVDFNRAGEIGAILNQMIPFFNAAVQGNDKMLRTLFRDKGGRSQAWLRAVAMITLPSMLLWYFNHDEEWYKDLPLWVRNHSWCISPDGGKTVMVLAKPFELGILYGSMAERFMEYANEQDKEAVDSWFVALKNTVQPFQLHQLAGPMAAALWETKSNYDSYREAEIVKGSLKGLEPKLQYTYGTTEFAKWLGDIAPGRGISPQKIDHFIRGSFGGLGRYAAEMASFFVEATSPSRKRVRPKDHMIFGLVPDKTPMLRAFFREPPESYSRYLDTFFNMKDRSDEATKSWTVLTRGGARPAQLEDSFRRNAILLALSKPLNRTGRAISEITKSIKMIEVEDTGRFTRKEKTIRIDELKVRRNDLVRETIMRIEKELDAGTIMSDAEIDAMAKRIRSQAEAVRMRQRLKGAGNGD